MRMLLVLAMVGCGASSSNSTATNATGEPVAGDPEDGELGDGDLEEPAEVPDDMLDEIPPDGPTQNAEGVFVSYAIDGRAVHEATFTALFSRLDVEEEAYEGETVENPDGSYGGAGQSFHARDGDIEYRYENHVYPREDGTRGESRLLFRVVP